VPSTSAREKGHPRPIPRSERVELPVLKSSTLPGEAMQRPSSRAWSSQTTIRLRQLRPGVAGGERQHARRSPEVPAVGGRLAVVLLPALPLLSEIASDGIAQRWVLPA